jgi:hypothetical protein
MKLPSKFDPSVNLIARQEENGVFHSVVESAALAESLMRDNSENQTVIVEKIIAAVLDCQITDEDDPHFGNFLWEKESEVVEDLNAIEFMMFRLIPLLAEFSDRLAPATRDRMHIAIRNGMTAIARIDVDLMYTNIVLKDICNSILGGELLGEIEIAERGYMKLRRWFDRTRNSGIPTEYNSPPYTGLAIEVLGRLASNTTDEDTRVLATVATARIALSAGLRINPETRRWAGPFGRAYRDAVLAEGPSEIDRLKSLVSAGLAPNWMIDVIDHSNLPQDVVETSDVDTQTVVSTHHSKSFSLGVASRELSTQSNRFIAAQSQAFDLRYYAPKMDRIATMTTRYVHDDAWLGKYQVTPSRGWDHVFPEQGKFRGVQRGPSAIGVAMSNMLGAERSHSRAYLAVVWTDAESVESIYVNGNLVGDLPVEIPPGSNVTVVTETAMVGVRVLGQTNLGITSHAPIELVERDGMISLDIHNYAGPEKTFWELANPGAFFQGLPYCAFYSEVVERSEWKTVAQFMDMFSSGNSTAKLQESLGIGTKHQRVLTTQYSRSGQVLGLELDLVSGELVRRFTERGDMDLPKLESEIAVHSDASPIKIGDSRLEFGSGDAWLLSIPEIELSITGIQGDTPTDVTLTTARGHRQFEGMTNGLIVWRGDELTVTSTPGNVSSDSD